MSTTIIAMTIGAGKIDREFGLRCQQRQSDAPFQCIRI